MPQDLELSLLFMNGPSKQEPKQGLDDWAADDVCSREAGENNGG